MGCPNAYTAYQHRTPSEHRKVLISSGASDLVADLLLGIDRLFRESSPC